jgi:DNA-directed RNA polymerase
LEIFLFFRGRIYPLFQYLSYHGSDIARALLLFDKNEEINTKGIDYVKIYLANLSG